MSNHKNAKCRLRPLSFDSTDILDPDMAMKTIAHITIEKKPLTFRVPVTEKAVIVNILTDASCKFELLETQKFCQFSVQPPPDFALIADEDDPFFDLDDELPVPEPFEIPKNASPQLRKILDLVNAGETQAEIIRKLKTSSSTIVKILKKEAGIAVCWKDQWRRKWD